MDSSVVHQLSRLINESDRRKLLTDTQYRTDWIYDVAKQIVAKEDKVDG